jgi:integrase
MLIKAQNFVPISCDQLGLPRFWSFAWSNTKLAGLANSTRTRRLSDVDKFYNFVDETHQFGALDDALARVDIDILADMFFGYFHHIQLHAAPGSDPSSQAFKHAYDFVIETCKLMKPTVDFKEVDQKIRSLENIYGSLRFNQKTGVVQIRVLPTDVLDACIRTINPDSANLLNPFKRDDTRWKNFLVFMLLLETGIRGAEALLLPAIRPYHQGVDQFTGEHTIWMNIQTLPDEQDDSDAGGSGKNKYRSGRDVPALKNAYATRQITISRELASYIDYYLEHVRPANATHQYLICNNRDGAPLSLRGLRKIFETLTDALPKEVLNILEARTQGSRSVSAHDLRHTCATVCMHEWSKENDSTEVLARMRRKFGWSADSTMPSRYAALAYDQRISIWINQRQNVRVEALRSLAELEGSIPR